MEAALLYWLKANVVLALFGAAYYGLLRRLTFFGLNRAYLLLAVVFSVAYPLLPVPTLLPAGPAGLPLLAAPHLPPLGPGPAGAGAPAGYAGCLLWGGASVYAAGAAALLARLLLQMLSLAWVRRRSRPAAVLGQAVRVVPGAGGPFSFGATIYLTESTLADRATLLAALRHEQAHVRQGHTLDVLLLQVATALAWPNPVAWLLRRATLDNLEYLADQATLRGTDLSRRAYQYLLLRQQAGEVPTPALAFRVEFFTLKSRIAMLNQPLSARRQRGRYLLATLLVTGLALGCAGAQAQTAPKPGPGLMSQAVSMVYYLDGRQVDKGVLDQLAPADMVDYINVLKPAQAQRVFGQAVPAVVVTTKAKANDPAVLAFNQRLNEVVPLVPATPAQNEAMQLARTYLAQHYPAARLESLAIVPGQADRYRATFTAAGKRTSLLFDGRGHVVP